MIKKLVDQGALGLFTSRKTKKPVVQKMPWMERWADNYKMLYFSLVIIAWNFQLTLFFFQAFLGRPLRVSFALEKVRGAPVVVPRLTGTGNADRKTRWFSLWWCPWHWGVVFAAFFRLSEYTLCYWINYLYGRLIKGVYSV